ncbi:Biotin carboxyl carrier protein of acetyl-CoA carboxylase [hydrothermal vent metagenome]|uniref:Biotin carboxyl carrier protein of acetyl-CoA carboxylase n=1 Tax=hydrothermal vent metagenome TaxID=652676 RepID=A0A3B1DAJ7_9ZZZZ
MNLKEIKEIISLMNDNDLMEVEIEREGSKVKLKKTSGNVVMSAPVSMPAMAAASVQGLPVPAAPVSTVENNVDRQEIKSPMVGTFYTAPGPDADPFVKVGDVVDVGHVVGIVEAMKLMNEIKSEIKGKIVESAIDNAQPVEFGQALFYVEKV